MLEKKGRLDLEQLRKIKHDRNEWREFGKREAFGTKPRSKPWNLTKCHNAWLLYLYKTPRGMLVKKTIKISKNELKVVTDDVFRKIRQGREHTPPSKTAKKLWQK